MLTAHKFLLSYLMPKCFIEILSIYYWFSLFFNGISTPGVISHTEIWFIDCKNNYIFNDLEELSPESLQRPLLVFSLHLPASERPALASLTAVPESSSNQHQQTSSIFTNSRSCTPKQQAPVDQLHLHQQQRATSTNCTAAQYSLSSGLLFTIKHSD